MPSLSHPPTSDLPMSSCTSHPYSTVNSGGLIYTNVPVSCAEYYPGAPPSMHSWEGEGQLPNFDPSFVRQHTAHPAIEGEVPINIIDQSKMEQEMMAMANISFYPDGSPIPTGDVAGNASYCDMTGMPMQHPDLPPGVCLLPPPLCATQKPKREHFNIYMS